MSFLNSAGLFDAIPDSVNNHYPADAGSGSTLSNVEGSVAASLNGGFSWVSNSKYSGDAAVDYDGVDGYWLTDSAIACNQSQATIMFWTDSVSPSDDFARLIQTGGDPASTPSDGIELEFDQASTTSINVKHVSGGTSTAAYTATVPDTSTQDLFWAVILDGDTSTLLVYDLNGKQTDTSGTQTRGTGDQQLLGMAGDGRYSTGVMDNALTATAALTQSEVEDVRDATAGGRL